MGAEARRNLAETTGNLLSKRNTQTEKMKIKMGLHLMYYGYLELQLLLREVQKNACQDDT